MIGVNKISVQLTIQYEKFRALHHNFFHISRGTILIATMFGLFKPTSPLFGGLLWYFTFTIFGLANMLTLLQEEPLATLRNAQTKTSFKATARR